MSDNIQKRDDGRFDQLYEDQEFINALSQNGGDIDTSSIAKSVGASRRHTYERLRNLESEGIVESKLVGNSLEWAIVEDDGNPLSDTIDFISTKLSKNPPISLDSAKGMVIAIRDPHSKAILNGKKTVEFRKSRFKKSNTPEVGFIYEPSPTKAIVGIFSIKSIQFLSIDELKDLAKNQATSTPESIERYFNGKKKGTAIFIDHVETIDPPISLNAGRIDGWAFTPPQNFYYVDPGEFMRSIHFQNLESPSGEPQEVGSSSRTS